jgi:hypothetical protein
MYFEDHLIVLVRLPVLFVTFYEDNILLFFLLSLKILYNNYKTLSGIECKEEQENCFVLVHDFLLD